MKTKSVVLEASPKWQSEIEDAMAIDRECVKKYGQADRDHHLVCTQRSQQQRGFLSVCVTKNIYGWCVRDRTNDGIGNISGNGSLEFAADFAVRFHADSDGKVEVVAYDDEARSAVDRAAKNITISVAA